MGQLVRVELLTSVCDTCGQQTIRSAEHDENLRRLAARKDQYGGLLLGEEIARLRLRYGLTQQAASKIFGKGKIAFSRYENEATYPDESTTLLLTLAIERPDVLKWLADRAGVEIPLWRARVEDAKTAVRPLPPGIAQLAAVRQRVSIQGTTTSSVPGWRDLGERRKDRPVEVTRRRLQLSEEAA